jgi:hypothetical protein
MAAFAVSCLAAVLGLVYALTRNGQGIVISMGPDNPNGANQGQSNPAQDRIMPSAEPRPRPRAASQSLARDIEARQRDPQLKEKMAESEKWLQSIGDKADAAGSSSPSHALPSVGTSVKALNHRDRMPAAPSAVQRQNLPDPASLVQERVAPLGARPAEEHHREPQIRRDLHCPGLWHARLRRVQG